ncbi:MAG: UbiA family prenyltransferase [Deltaproteobacteria bacterium]|jgi:4-hydroxybenzoate polyprenyltransferase/phosphoserine phosphatase|nr:UbiA family prenyltransferase [Deltaproteobacteria bacterium]
MISQQSKNLVIDLDGTLLKTDSLWELFFKALSNGHLESFIWLLSGRAHFKNRLASSTELDLNILPWNQEVIDLARVSREKGGQVWLATASDEILARKVTEHFDFFSGCISSDGRQNLKGEAKALELVKRFGTGGFIYAGNSSADVKVWAAAGEAIVVGDSNLASKARQVNSNVTVLAPGSSSFLSFRPILKVTRMHQWAKNFLLFVPLIMGHFFSWNALAKSAAGFLAFCFISSAGYILNDLLDIDSDRRHPEKRNRPFASGSVDLPQGFFLFTVSLSAGLLVALIVGLPFLTVALLYFIAAALYSLSLKLVNIVDIVVLTLLYCLRVFAGGVATNVEISQWLLSFSFFVFAALSLIKRLGELRRTSIEGTESNSRRPYESNDAVFFLTLTSGCICSAVLTLAIYVGDAAAFSRYRSPELLLLFCPVLFYWLARLLKLADGGKMPYDPVFFTLTDKVSWFCLGLGILAYLLATIGVGQ